MATRRYERVDSAVTPRFAGLSTFMRLPVLTDPHEVDIAIVEVPWGSDTTNRSVPRPAPRQVRELSSLIKCVHSVTNISPSENDPAD